jgi:hypothetical protein
VASHESKSAQGAIGFRVKSGWATAVLVTGSAQSPRVVDRRTIQLCDAAIPESRQPYHAAMGKLQTDEAKVERLRKVVMRAADRSLTELVGDYRVSGHPVHAVGLVVGSALDPAKITNPHIRAHALEGQLFRTALEAAARSCSLACSVVVERNAYAHAAEILRRSEDDLKQMLAGFGRSLGGSWRADDKIASLAAWLALQGSIIQQ